MASQMVILGYDNPVSQHSLASYVTKYESRTFLSSQILGPDSLGAPPGPAARMDPHPPAACCAGSAGAS